MTYRYQNHGTCSREVIFDLDENKKLHNIRFIGGCSGNTQGVCRLAEGMDAAEAVTRLLGIRCGVKPTSCPDQLAQAIQKALAE